MANTCPTEPCIVCGKDCCTLEMGNCKGPMTHMAACQMSSKSWVCGYLCWEKEASKHD